LTNSIGQPLAALACISVVEPCGAGVGIGFSLFIDI
jgi:hypothetical protein